MSNHLGISESVALLEALRGLWRDFALRQEKLNQELQTRTDAAAKQWDNAQGEATAKVSAEIAEKNAAFETGQARTRSRFEGRKGRLLQAYNSRKRQVATQIDAEEGRRKYEAQKGLLEATRGRTESLARNDTTQADFNRQLTENRTGFMALEEDAAKRFRGYGRFRRLLSEDATAAPFDSAGDEYQLLEQLRALQQTTERGISRFRRFIWPNLFKFLPIWFCLGAIVLLVAGLAAAVRQGNFTQATIPQIALGGASLAVLFLGAYFYGRQRALPLARSIAANLEAARQIHNLALDKAQARHREEAERIEAETKQRMQVVEENWEQALARATHDRAVIPAQLEQRFRRITQKNEESQRRRLAALRSEHTAVTSTAREQVQRDQAGQITAHQSRQERFQAEHRAQWENLVQEWQTKATPLLAKLAETNAIAASDFPTWEDPVWEQWQPPALFKNAVKFAQLDAEIRKSTEPPPSDSRLTFPAHISLPLTLTYPDQGSLLFETTKSGSELVMSALNNIVLRLLATTPAGRLSFTIIDPIKLGQNFATIMHLADYEENLINGRIWTQTGQIEQRLGELNEHMEKMIQMYLRNDYSTIAEYNREAGNIAEKYHFVVIADFPANFSALAARRLLHIAASGARCGVYTLIHWDHRHPVPPDFFADDLRKSSICIGESGTDLILTHPAASKAKVVPDRVPEAEFATRFLHQIGEISRGANRVEVPFAQIAPTEAEMWTSKTAEELRVPIGRSGATKLQELTLGKGTRQHALVAGKTGSGKSTLFHVMITNLALWCSPEEVEFYLVDFKKGVEFKSYAAGRLPHARVVAIESDREFGLSVLQRVDDELRRRGDLFRRLGVQDVAGYKRASNGEALPRTLLIIDEFQEFFVEDDRISQAAAVLLDRIVRQGRAFGIHVLLGSQTLGGAYSLARTTLGQMVIRIALQCNEADAYLIMDETNPAPRLLSRPGEGIYNDMAGAVEGNSPFQVVWLGDKERDRVLARVRSRADERPEAYPGPIVFEGNAPADPAENSPLRTLLNASSVQPSPIVQAWLGAPNSIKGPTAATFTKRSGNNLLLVGQRDEAVLALFSTMLLSLAAQYPKEAARFILFESTVAGSAEREHFAKVTRVIPHGVTLAKASDLNELVSGVRDELNARVSNEKNGPDIFLFIHGLQHFKKFRQDDDFAFSLDADAGPTPAAQLTQIITEGPSHGVHVIVSVDTFNNVNRFLGRKLLSEFEMRVLFQMSANDSASLCDDPKASMLGLHRALFYNEQEGHLETFRPYALPTREWMEETGARLRRLLGAQSGSEG